MLRLKFDVDKKLREMGVTPYSSRSKGGGIAQGTFTKLKNGIVPTGAIDQICSILKCQPGDLIEWVPDEEPEMEMPE